MGLAYHILLEFFVLLSSVELEGDVIMDSWSDAIKDLSMRSLLVYESLIKVCEYCEEQGCELYDLEGCILSEAIVSALEVLFGVAKAGEVRGIELYGGVGGIRASNMRIMDLCHNLSEVIFNGATELYCKTVRRGDYTLYFLLYKDNITKNNSKLRTFVLYDKGYRDDSEE